MSEVAKSKNNGFPSLLGFPIYLPPIPETHCLLGPSQPGWQTRGGYKTADMERCQGGVLKIIAAIWLARSTRGRERSRQSLNKAQCIQILRFCSINSARDVPGDPVAKTLLPREGTQVQIPGGGTRFCMQDSAAKLKKKKSAIMKTLFSVHIPSHQIPAKPR